MTVDHLAAVHHVAVQREHDGYHKHGPRRQAEVLPRCLRGAGVLALNDEQGRQAAACPLAAPYQQGAGCRAGQASEGVQPLLGP